MKTITGILFVLGIGWALLAWIVMTAPVGILLPAYHYDAHDIAFSLTGATLAATGYWVWLGWGCRWRKGFYPRVSGRVFWMISLIHHLLWVVVLPFGYETSVREFWNEGYELPFRSWIAINVAVALLGMFVEGGGKVAGKEGEDLVRAGGEAG